MMINRHTLIALCMLIVLKSNSITVQGFIKDISTNLPVKNCMVKIFTMGTKNSRLKRTFDTLLTDINGKFIFQLDSNKISMAVSAENYVTKHYDLYTIQKDTLYNISIRKKSEFIFKTLHIDSLLIGISITDFFKTYQLDQGDIRVIEEPPFIARGMVFYTGDDYTINVFIDRKAYFIAPLSDLNDCKIIGLSYTDIGCENKRYYGTGIPWFRLTGCISK